jgi:hypothetical protein
MNKKIWIILGIVLVLTVLSISTAMACCTVPPPPWWPPTPPGPGPGPGPGLGVRCGFNIPPVDGVGGYFVPCNDELRPPPMGLTCFGSRSVIHIIDDTVCFDAPFGGYNFTIRYWFNGQWHILPTTYSNCKFCAETVPGVTYYSLQGIAFGRGIWEGILP